MRKFDPINIGIYLLSIMLVLGINVAACEIYGRNNTVDIPDDSNQIVQDEVGTDDSEVDDEAGPGNDTDDDILEKPANTYFDVPLDEDLQDHIFEVCEIYEVDPAIVVAMIKKESTYRPGTIGDNGNSFGLMQVQPKWHQARMDKLGVTDLLDPYQNVLVGVDYLAELFGHGRDLKWTLMAYNGGVKHANKMTMENTVTDYAKIVMATAEELRASV